MNYEIIYLPDDDFTTGKVRDIFPHWELIGVDGKMRWLVTDKDGVQKIVRPESTRP